MKKLFAFVLGLALLWGVGTSAKEETKTPIVKATGTIVPEEVIDIDAQVSGTIVELGPDPNDPKKTIDFNSVVKKGTVLARISSEHLKEKLDLAKAKLKTAKAQLALAKVRVTLAQRELQRTKKREEQKRADSFDIEVAKAALDVAKAAAAVEEASADECKPGIERAERELGYATIRSPAAGVIVHRRVNVGQKVYPSLNAPSLFVIAANLKKLQLWASVPEKDIVLIEAGKPASITVDAYPNDLFKGKVLQTRLNAILAKDQVTYTVVIELDNSDGKLLPYMTATVKIEGKSKVKE